VLFWKSGIGTVTYSSWNSGEPNNGAGPEMFLEHSGRGWNDASDTSRGSQRYIVEYGPAVSSVPEPSVMALTGAGFVLLCLALGRHKGAREE
jgi:hypothetical protein